MKKSKDFFGVVSYAETPTQYQNDNLRFMKRYFPMTMLLSFAVGLNVMLGEMMGIYPHPPFFDQQPSNTGFAALLATFVLLNVAGQAKESVVNKTVRNRLRRQAGQ